MYYQKIVSIASETWKTLSFDPPLSLDNLDNLNDYCGQKECVSHALAQDFDKRRPNKSPTTLFFLWLNYPGGATFKPEYIDNIISAKKHTPGHFKVCLYCNHDKFLTSEMKVDPIKHNITIKILKSSSENHDQTSKRLRIDNSIIRPKFMIFDTVKTALKKLKKEGSLIEDITALAYEEEDEETANILQDELTEMSLDTVFERYFDTKNIGLDVDMMRLLIMLAKDTPTIYMDLDIKVHHEDFFKPIQKAQTVAAFISNADNQPLLNNDYMKLSPEILRAYIVRILKNFCIDTAGECEWENDVPKTSGPYVFMQTIADFLEGPERKKDICLLPSGVYGEQGLAKNNQEQTWEKV